MLAHAPETFTTAYLPGLEGPAHIKTTPDDFVVEEMPAYAPSGTGDHLFLWVEKRGMSADALIGHVARGLGVDRRDIGCAGLKDTHAVTRQYLSVPVLVADRVDALRTDQLQVLTATPHNNKLKTGHLRGNRFTIRVPNQSADDARRAQAIATALQTTGMANFYGAQRFGRDGSTLRIGMDLLANGGDGAPGRPLSRMLRRLALSCVQSALYNQILSQRLKDGLLDQVIPGDVCLVRASGGPFVTDDAPRETARFAAKEVVHAGPMFGPKMRAAQHMAAERERACLAAAGLSEGAFRGFGKMLQGTRRANVVWPEDLSVVHHEDASLQLQFGLPPGSYATILLREFWRQAPADAGQHG